MTWRYSSKHCRPSGLRLADLEKFERAERDHDRFLAAQLLFPLLFAAGVLVGLLVVCC